MKEQAEFYLSEYTRFIASQIHYSHSGELNNIDRGEFGKYKPMGPRQIKFYKHLDYYARKGVDGTSIRFMFEHHTADCGDQAFYLSFLLNNTPVVTEAYKIFYVGFQDGDANHSFVVLIPKGELIIERLERFNNLFGHPLKDAAKASLFLNNTNFIFGDPWQNLIFHNGITLDNNPFNFKKNIDISKHKWIVQEHEASLYIRGIQEDLLDNLIMNSPSLDKDIKSQYEEQGNYSALFLHLCADDKHLELVKLLLDNNHIFEEQKFTDEIINEAKQISLDSKTTNIFEFIEKYENIILHEKPINKDNTIIQIEKCTETLNSRYDAKSHLQPQQSLMGQNKSLFFNQDIEIKLGDPNQLNLNHY